MSHPTTETLSAYLDRELASDEQGEIDAHLEDCHRCQSRLNGLRRVVEELQGLERAATPPVLDQWVQRRIALEPLPKTPMERLEARLGRFHRLRPSIGLIFALTLALSIVVYLFAVSLSRQNEGPVVVPVPSLAESVELEGRIFELTDAAWVERGVEVVASRRVEAESDEGRALLSEHPWLIGLLEQRDRVVVELDPGDPVALQR